MKDSADLCALPSRPQVLLVGKVPSIYSLNDEDLDRLADAAITDPDSLREREAQHLDSLDRVRQALNGCRIRERRVDELRSDDLAGIDLVVCVGGDGTVLAVAGLLPAVPLLAVNSDPSRSVGHFTRYRDHEMGACLERLRSGAAEVEAIPRLTACVGEQPACHHILNDALFTNENPAAMTRYRLRIDQQTELQHSSGVWISTGAGSTAAIHSAGLDPISPHESALLFLVREPYQGRGPLRLLRGRHLPPQTLELTAAATGIRLYIDGSHSWLPVPAGITAHFSASPYPLRLVADCSTS
ncbi:MAG: NAD(+)/NADH kinase [Planctomycetota bacterium]